MAVVVQVQKLYIVKNQQGRIKSNLKSSSEFPPKLKQEHLKTPRIASKNQIF